MRAGNLDRIIRVQYHTTVPDAYGTPTDDYSAERSVRAQVLQFATDDRETAGGNRTDTSITFRIRFIEGVDLENRVSYDHRTYAIRQIQEIGRRVGLDLVCERVGQ